MFIYYFYCLLVDVTLSRSFCLLNLQYIIFMDAVCLYGSDLYQELVPKFITQFQIRVIGTHFLH